MTNKNEFGRYTTLRPIDRNGEEEKDTNKIPRTRIIRISERMYRRIVGHAKKYYKNVEPYETIQLDCYQKQNTPYYSHFHWDK